MYIILVILVIYVLIYIILVILVIYVLMYIILVFQYTCCMSCNDGLVKFRIIVFVIIEFLILY
jgi:apolipoprotein N-acyltransferase